MAAKKIELNESREVTLSEEQIEEAIVDYLAKAGRVLTVHAVIIMHGVPIDDEPGTAKAVELRGVTATADVEPKARKPRAAKV